MKRKYIIQLIIATFSLVSCEKILEVKPPINQLSSEAILDDEKSVNAITSGLYTQFYTLLNINLNLLPAFTSDELVDYTNSYNSYVANAIPSTDQRVKDVWDACYKVIYKANTLIDGLESDSRIQIKLKNQIIGEALAIRALIYYHLILQFGDVPAIWKTNIQENISKNRSPEEEILAHLVKDLIEACNKLDDAYINNERIRINKTCALTILSKVYLKQKRWQEAENICTQIIATPGISIVKNLSLVFNKNSSETILQIWNTSGFNSIAPLITPSLAIKYGFKKGFIDSIENGDKRKEIWTKSITTNGQQEYYPNKYKQTTITTSNQEYAIVFRLSEVILTRAEALINQNKIESAISDLDSIRIRAGLKPYKILHSNPTVSDISSQIIKDRRYELFNEWGNRWADLKRTNIIDSVMKSVNPTWTSTDKLYPIPQVELNNNINLKPNPGY